MGTAWPIIYLEGLPGLGKTTAAVNLAATVDQIILVAENNPSPSSYSYVQNLDPTARALWYLETEGARSAYVTTVAHAQQGRTVVCDKGALATLAYTYATCRIGKYPSSLYDQVCDTFLTHSRSHPPVDAVVVVFVGSPDLSLHRRRGKANSQVRALWFDERFLRAYARFFTHEAPELTTALMMHLDATIDRVELMTRIAALAGLHANWSPREERPSPELSLLFRRYAENATEEILGRPVGPPFMQLDNTAQAFERHLLLRKSRGIMHLQQQYWETTPRLPGKRLPSEGYRVD